MTAPARRQYLDIKAQHPDAILLYQVGDFYETFDDDARIAAHELQIVLTGRSYGTDERVPLAGVPVHALETYAARLVARGYKVAICEQIGVPPARGLVKREVTRILTPGTVVSPAMVPPSRDNYLVAIVTTSLPAGGIGLDRAGAGLAYIDASSGTFCCTEWPTSLLGDTLRAEIERLSPAEVLVADNTLASSSPSRPELWFGQLPLTPCPAEYFDAEKGRDRLCRHFATPTPAPFVPPAKTLAIAASGAILAYLERMNPALLSLVTSLSYYETIELVQVDGRTWQALEVVEPAHSSSLLGGRSERQATLLSILDRTRTLMGSRLLRRRVLAPLSDRSLLEERLDAVGEIYADSGLGQLLADTVEGLPDLERLAARIVQGTASPRELVALRAGLKQSSELTSILAPVGSAALQRVRDSIDPCPEVSTLIDEAIADAGRHEGRIIRPGYSSALDELIAGVADARDWIAGLESAERERTGIKSLKVGFNKVFGYYLEISRANLSKVPADYRRRQTLVNGERYITAELKEREAVILHAEEQINELELGLYRSVLERISEHLIRLRATALAIAELDTYLALAQVALANGYARPELSDATGLCIEAGRHPIVEASLDPSRFVANDTRLDQLLAEDQQGTRIMLLTGPNMAGKSTYLRQVATIVLMAQIGSFVPARSAHIGLVDRISCRVGAEDDLARGMSTFMLEMVETAYILRQSTARSLVILDEVGRGTSTHDGLAIARAVTEYLHDVVGARTLFATHFHELAIVEEHLSHLAAFQMDVIDRDGEPIFQHRVVPGASSESYGVHVAQMAGLPPSVTQRAAEVLKDSLTIWSRSSRSGGEGGEARLAETPQSYGDVPAPLDNSRAIAVALATLNIAAMTPMEALNLLFSLQQQALTVLRLDEYR